MFNIKVESIPVKIISSVQIRVVSVELYASAKVEVSLLDAAGKLIERKSLLITGAEYQGWNEDSYLEALVLNKLNLTKYVAVPEGTAEAEG